MIADLSVLKNKKFESVKLNIDPSDILLSGYKKKMKKMI